MLAPQRHALIMAQLDQETTVSIRALTECLGVSRETIRKDIEHLARTAKLEQVRGGATRIRTQEVPMAVRSQINAEGKARIARTLAARIPHGASIFLDNGSSTRALADALTGHEELSVYTNDLEVARILAQVCANLVLMGGRLDIKEMATFGNEAVEQAAKYHVDISVISAGGLSARAMLTDFSADGVNLRAQISISGQTRYVVADKEKFGVVGQYALAVSPEDTCLVLDRDPPDDLRAALQSHELTYFVASGA